MVKWSPTKVSSVNKTKLHLIIAKHQLILSCSYLTYYQVTIYKIECWLSIFYVTFQRNVLFCPALEWILDHQCCRVTARLWYVNVKQHLIPLMRWSDNCVWCGHIWTSLSCVLRWQVRAREDRCYTEFGLPDRILEQIFDILKVHWANIVTGDPQSAVPQQHTLFWKQTKDKIHAVPKAALWGAMTRKQVLMKFCTSRGPLHLKANLTCFCPKISKPQLTHLKLQYLSSWTNGFRMFLGRREKTGELTVRTLTLFSCLAIVLWTMKLFIASFLQCNRDFAPACFWLVMHSSKAGLSFFYEPTLHFSPGHSRRATKRFLFCFLKSVCSFLLYLLGVSLFVCLFGNLCETPFVKWWCPFFTRISLFGFVLPFRFSYLIIILEWNALWKPVVVGAESTL